ncbi:hypothetical protein MTR67_000741 [Solanum verrucosum]|uniref:Uncharacterized protein n=1 Tax=Solanum verrucosum TaxID=315347 RepID=A0AAF0T6U6_SOLVR|nr:hypothetical protein MTR67_000741 [Solanum verrucosum]
MLAKQKMENMAYYAHNKAQEGESLVRSMRVRNKACEFKSNLDNDCKGKQRRMTKKK